MRSRYSEKLNGTCIREIALALIKTKEEYGPFEKKVIMIYAVLAYLTWGFIPAYLKLLSHLPITEVMFHRSFWAIFIFTGFVFWQKKRLTKFFSLSLKQKLYLIIASGLLGANWAIYLYAVNTNQVIEGSLGYFINPLINFLLGFLFLNERMPKPRAYAVALATLGVLWLTFLAGQFPWIGISLGMTFGFYGLIRKVAGIEPATALQVESVFLSVGWLFVFYTLYPTGRLIPHETSDLLLLIGAGFTTGIPLLWFSKAVLQVPLNVLGFLQFISPTIQFALGVFFYSEHFPPQKLIGFLFIWAAVLLLVLELILRPQRSQRKAFK